MCKLVGFANITGANAERIGIFFDNVNCDLVTIVSVVDKISIAVI